MTLDGNDFLDITLNTCSIKEKKKQTSLKLKASYLSESLLWELGGNMPYFVLVAFRLLWLTVSIGMVQRRLIRMGKIPYLLKIW